MKETAGVYLLGGITLVSEIALPELPRIQHQGGSAHPVHIRLGSILDHLRDAIEIDPDCFATPTQYFLRIHGIACYLVTDGQEIVVSPEDGALPLDVRAYLLGTLFVVLCQQRGLLPLHASAISSSKGAVAFLARSGQGKSSLAAHLAQRGFRVLADDVCLIDFAAMVIPTAPWLKLWRNSLQNLGLPADGLERIFSQDDKYRLPLKNVGQPQAIGRLLFLQAGEGSVLDIQEISAVEAIPLLMDLTHQSSVLQATGQLQENFLRCSRVSSQAKAYRLIRPWGMTHMQATVDAVQRFLQDE